MMTVFMFCLILSGHTNLNGLGILLGSQHPFKRHGQDILRRHGVAQMDYILGDPCYSGRGKKDFTEKSMASTESLFLLHSPLLIYLLMSFRRIGHNRITFGLLQ